MLPEVSGRPKIAVYSFMFVEGQAFNLPGVVTGLNVFCNKESIVNYVLFVSESKNTSWGFYLLLIFIFRLFYSILFSESLGSMYVLMLCLENLILCC